MKDDYNNENLDTIDEDMGIMSQRINRYSQSDN